MKVYVILKIITLMITQLRSQVTFSSSNEKFVGQTQYITVSEAKSNDKHQDQYKCLKCMKNKEKLLRCLHYKELMV